MAGKLSIALLLLCGCKSGEGEHCSRHVSCDDGLTCVELKCLTEKGIAEHCQNKCAAERDGRCSARGAECAIETDADCRSSEGCAEEGACSHRVATGSPLCVAADDTDCADSSACKRDGRCTARYGSCVE